MNSACSNGLAERANELMGRTDTSFELWRGGLVHRRKGIGVGPTPTPESNAKSTGLALPKADLRLVVREVLWMNARPRNKGKNSSKSKHHQQEGYISALARCSCQISQPSSTSDPGERSGSGLKLVLFRFCDTSGPSTTVGSSEGFESGSEVMLWEPWNTCQADGGEEMMICTRFAVSAAASTCASVLGLGLGT